MDTKALRQKILDLAIHGKLVPPDPNDEPASVLLERIRAEKERLIKEGKIKKGKKSAKTSDKPHYPFELPKGWEWVTLEDICAKFSTGPFGSMVHKSDYVTANGVPIVNPANIVNGTISSKNIMYISKDKSIELERYKLEVNDIVLARRGDLTKCTIVGNEQVDFICGTGSFFLHLISVLPQYFQLVYMSSYVQIILTTECVGATMNNLNQSVLSQILFPLPPLAEQKRVVARTKYMLSIITTLDNEQYSLHTTIKQAKAKVLDLAIHGKLVSQDPNDEPASEHLKRINPKAEIITDNGHYQKLPVGWCMTNIESLFEAVSAKRVLKSEWKNKGIPFYRAREIVQLSKEGIADKDLFVSKEHYSELKEKYGVPSCDDIMISAVGSIGYTYIVKKGDVFYYKDASVLCLKNTNHWNPTFFKIWLASPFLQEQMYKNSKGTTVNTITLEKLKGYVIPLPPITEQHRIVSKVEDLFSQLDNIASSL